MRTSQQDQDRGAASVPREVADWFPAWLKWHFKCFPEAVHIDPGGEDGAVYYKGWIVALQDCKATAELAYKATEMLEADPPARKSLHLKAIVAAIGLLKEQPAEDKSAEQAADLGRAVRKASLDCPECEGSGWAKRHVEAPACFGGSFALSLFCRCRKGRMMRRQEDERDEKIVRKEKHAEHQDLDDLQARPDLWVPDRSHPSWSDVPVAERRWASRSQYLPAVGPPAREENRPARRLARVPRGPVESTS